MRNITEFHSAMMPLPHEFLIERERKEIDNGFLVELGMAIGPEFAPIYT